MGRRKLQSSRKLGSGRNEIDERGQTGTCQQTGMVRVREPCERLTPLKKENQEPQDGFITLKKGEN